MNNQMSSIINLTNPIFWKDFYKVSHYEQYPPGTTLIFSNFTPRKFRTYAKHAVFFGIKHFLHELNGAFKLGFFDKPLNEVMDQYKYVMEKSLGSTKNFDHIAELHKLGYLPIEIRCLPEGALVPQNCPALVIYNTDPRFYWVTNMLETYISCSLWGPCTSATTAHEFRLLLDHYAAETSDIPEFVDFQAHDFSFRGMYGVNAAIMSGAAHLHYFKGTDTIPAIFLQQVYDSDRIAGFSVPATEHSVMCTGTKENEYETYERLITELYPSGIVSIVSDTWDLWNVVDNYLPKLKDKIMARDGKVVIRPDSGDPVDILCGDRGPWKTLTQKKGLIQRLAEIFGTTTNSKGYMQLDPHIGAIYGDAINYDRCETILDRLKDKGFASTNVVFGIGSYSYQYVTRDTLGWAIKATYAEINGKGIAISKNPATDDGTKKSHLGLLKVIKNADGNYECVQNVDWQQFNADDNELKLAYRDGEIYL